MDKYSSWIGVGFKGGGILGIGGVDYVSGTLRNLGFLSEHHDFQIGSGRFGLGLGASVGAVACIVYNCANLWTLNDTLVDDWSINIAYGAKWDTVIKGQKNYKFFSIVSKINDITKTTTADIENLRNAAAYLYSAQDIAGNSPKLVTIDIPAAGVDLELSAFVMKGTIEIPD